MYVIGGEGNFNLKFHTCAAKGSTLYCVIYSKNCAPMIEQAGNGDLSHLLRAFHILNEPQGVFFLLNDEHDFNESANQSINIHKPPV